jgi:predicted secreted Zn-dependent protease
LTSGRIMVAASRSRHAAPLGVRTPDHQEVSVPPTRRPEPRARPARIALLVSLVASGALSAGALAQAPSEPPVSPICVLAFEEALGPAPSPSTPLDAPPSPLPSAVPSPSGSALPVATPSLPDPAILDDAIRSCASVEEWGSVAASYPDLFAGADPRAFLAQRCADPALGLDAYATCASLAIALASPSPAPTSEPDPSPAPTDGPDDDPTATTPDGSRLVRPPRRIRERVPGATSIRYFTIRGDSPRELIAQASRRSARFCPRHAAACVRYQPNVRARTQTNTQTGDCRIVGVSSTLTAAVFLPRWRASGRVEAALLAWWRTMSRRIAAHEARHIRIAKRHLADLPRRLVGRRCSAFSATFGRWTRALTRDQDAFDARDRERPLPPYRGTQP